MRHVELTCLHHPDLRWSCKEIAANSDGSYNGLRNIFYNGHVDGTFPAECKCSPADLRFTPAELERQKTEPVSPC